MTIRVLVARIFGIRHRHPAETELRDELAAHHELLVEEYRKQGLSPDEANRRASVRLGNSSAIREAVREQGGAPSIETAWQDLRYGVRILKRTPAFAGVAIVTLALAIGANTAMFSIGSALMLRSLPVRDPDRLFFIAWRAERSFGVTTSGYGLLDAAGKGVRSSLSYATFRRLQERADLFDSVVAYAPVGFGGESVNVAADGHADAAAGVMVSGNYFSSLGVTPELGRALVSDDEKPGAPLVAVLGYRYWSRRFARDARTIGSTIYVNGTPATIVGVAPRAFDGMQPGTSPDVYLPFVENRALMPWNASMTESPFTADKWWWAIVIVRLREGVSVQQAQAGSDVTFHQILESVRAADTRASLELLPAGRGLGVLRDRLSEPLQVLVFVAGVVLLIGCANIATLLMARAATRQRELAVRRALGASRERVIRQLLTECLLISALGGCGGLLLANWAAPALLLLLSATKQPVMNISVDYRVLAFATAVSLLTAVMFGIGPALVSSRGNTASVMKLRVTGLSEVGVRGGRLPLGRILIIAQVALSVVLLVGAGLFLRTFNNLMNRDLGFERSNVLLFRVDGRRAGYRDARLSSLYGQILERLQSLPAVRSATASELALLSGWVNSGPIAVEAQTGQAEKNTSYSNAVAPRFFETMQIPLLYGREIRWSDSANAPKVCVINEAMAQKYFGNGSPLGHRFSFGDKYDPKNAYEIVGVVRNAAFSTPRKIPPTAYTSLFQAPATRDVYFELRTASDPLAVVTDARRAVAGIDSNLPLMSVKTQTEQMEESISQERLFARLAMFCGLFALLLSGIGLHGTIAYGVTRRTPELGLRMALGAQRWQVLWMVLRQGILAIFAGIAIGIPLAFAAAWAARSVIANLLFGLQSSDPVTIGSAIIVMLLVGGCAAYLPARRATLLDPLEALRAE